MSLDWRSSESQISSQITAVDNFLSTVTVIGTPYLVDEFIIIEYQNVVPSTPMKVKIDKMLERIYSETSLNEGIDAVQDYFEGIFDGTRTLLKIENLEEGTLFIVYQ